MRLPGVSVLKQRPVPIAVVLHVRARVIVVEIICPQHQALVYVQWQLLSGSKRQCFASRGARVDKSKEQRSHHASAVNPASGGKPAVLTVLFVQANARLVRHSVGDWQMQSCLETAPALQQHAADVDGHFWAEILGRRVRVLAAISCAAITVALHEHAKCSL